MILGDRVEKVQWILPPRPPTRSGQHPQKDVLALHEMLQGWRLNSAGRAFQFLGSGATTSRREKDLARD